MEEFELLETIAVLKEEVAALRALANRANDRGEIENLFSRYMYYHNAFQDEQIIPYEKHDGSFY